MGNAARDKREEFNIFIVEDDYIYNKLATLITEKIVDNYDCPDINFQVNSFTSAQEFIKHLDRQPRIIILDYFFEINSNNNVSTAEEVLKKIREQAKDAQIIIVSSLTEIMKIVKLMELGAHHFILKDHDALSRLRATLRSIITNMLEKHYLS